MEPIVNGLEAEFGDQIEFLTVDANSPDGQVAFRAYRLQGHPAYVMLDMEGKVLWTSLGEQTAETLVRTLETVLNNQ